MNEIKLAIGGIKQELMALEKEKEMKEKDFNERMEQIRVRKSELNDKLIYLELEEYDLKQLGVPEIPEKMPYTFEDILKCKEITLDDVKKDYKNLCDFKADTNPRKFCGNKTIYQYQFAELLKCRRDTKNYKTIEEWFADPELKEQLWKDSVKRNKQDKNPYPSPTDVYECHRINNGAIIPFKASTAKYLYKRFNATSVLDPTMGWGGRMLGATSLGIHYTGFDTNIDLRPGYEKLIEDLSMFPNNVPTSQVKLFWETSLNEDIIKTLDYDMVLTSPPYENLELYQHMTPWETEDQFYKEFLIPLILLCNKYLNDMGVNCWNISPKMYKKLTEKYGFPHAHQQIDLRQQLGKQYKTKSQDYAYVWCKMHEVEK